MVISRDFCRNVKRISSPLVLLSLSSWNVIFWHSFYLWSRIDTNFHDLINFNFKGVRPMHKIIIKYWKCKLFVAFTFFNMFNIDFDYCVCRVVTSSHASWDGVQMVNNEIDQYRQFNFIFYTIFSMQYDFNRSMYQRQAIYQNNNDRIPSWNWKFTL